MGLISVEGIRVFAYHGHLPEEKILGGHFIVSVWVEANTSKVEESDDLLDTVDYVKIIEVVNKQMEIRASMIEVPARKIVDTILKMHYVVKVKVEIEKREPPVNAAFDKISFTCEGKN